MSKRPPQPQYGDGYAELNEEEHKSDADDDMGRSDDDVVVKMDYDDSSDEGYEESNSIPFSEQPTLKIILDPSREFVEKQSDDGVTIAVGSKKVYKGKKTNAKDEEEEERWDRYLRKSFISNSDDEEDDEVEREEALQRQKLMSGSLEHLLVSNKKKRKISTPVTRSEPIMDVGEKKHEYLTRNENIWGMYSTMPSDIAMLIYPFNVCTRNIPIDSALKFQTTFLLRIMNPFVNFVVGVLQWNTVCLIKHHLNKSNVKLKPDQITKHMKMVRMAAGIVYYLDVNEYKPKNHFIKIEDDEVKKLGLTAYERAKLVNTNILVVDILKSSDAQAATA